MCGAVCIRPRVLALPVLHPGLEPRMTAVRWASGVSAKCLASSLEALGEHFGWFLESGSAPVFMAEYILSTAAPPVPCPALFPSPERGPLAYNRRRRPPPPYFTMTPEPTARTRHRFGPSLSPQPTREKNGGAAGCCRVAGGCLCPEDVSGPEVVSVPGNPGKGRMRGQEGTGRDVWPPSKANSWASTAAKGLVAWRAGRGTHAPQAGTRQQSL